MPSAKFEYLLRLGDTVLVLSQRLSEWCGRGPVLEEDMALANTGLDLLGHARMWLTYAGEVEGKGRDEDALAYLRDDAAFRNMLLVERPNGNYADTLTRQFFFDAWHRLALAELVKSSDSTVAGIAGKALKEVEYHFQRSTDLIIRLGGGTDYSHRLMQAAVDEFWPYTGELFECDAVDQEMIVLDVGFDARSLRAPWLATVANTLETATLVSPPADAWMHKGGRTGVHTQALSYLLGEMQVLPRRYPGAQW
ncbi:MAG: phenylacetate-CoA oxygenase subunit PaaI [Nevskiaceae bacterium]|nr:MAG: phenylacetate-CoA oxygenase subunit PaaI [Nevskiaceae bacterium]TBR74247.1 MAG: phenylacetate-CoA oxygenase subunit PaaI [Nevskiaceae bacterium]